MSKRIFIVIFVFWITACVVGAEPLELLPDSKSSVVLRIRVLVAEAEAIPLTTSGDYWLYDEIKGEEVLYGGNSFSFVIEADEKGINIPYAGTFSGPIRLIPVDDAKVRLGQYLYRGELLVIKRNGHLQLINYVDLEEYLYGVIRREISPNWPIEAVKAQAVAARTYAFYQMIKNQSQPYDLDASTKSQVYGGFNSEAPGSLNAVDLTRGEIITYKEMPIQSLFHSNCGGFTEDVKNVFGNQDIPYLQGVQCRDGRGSKHFTWQQTIPLNQITSQLRKKGRSISSINSISTEVDNRSGRVSLIRINHDDGLLELSGKEFRVNLGNNTIKSTLFKVHIKGDRAIFNGRGWGHGVGLCQDGMRDMAASGAGYQEILQFYYLGTSVETLYEIYRRAGFVN